MPRTLGDSFIHISRLNYIIPVDYALPELAMAQEGSSEVAEKIAHHISDLIPDGATMQMGIGEIPDASLKNIYLRKNIWESIVKLFQTV